MIRSFGYSFVAGLAVTATAHLATWPNWYTDVVIVVVIVVGLVMIYTDKETTND